MEMESVVVFFGKEDRDNINGANGSKRPDVGVGFAKVGGCCGISRGSPDRAPHQRRHLIIAGQKAKFIARRHESWSLLIYIAGLYPRLSVLVSLGLDSLPKLCMSTWHALKCLPKGWQH